MGGERKKNSSLPNLQVFLYLNTFEHKIRIVISHNNITWYPNPGFYLVSRAMEYILCQKDGPFCC